MRHHRRDTRAGYVRTEAEATLGYLFLTSGPERGPCTRRGRPERLRGYQNADLGRPLYALGQRRRVRTRTRPARDMLLAKAWRDDGTPLHTEGCPAATKTSSTASVRAVRRWQGTTSTFFFTDGPSTTRARSAGQDIAEPGRALQAAGRRGAGTCPPPRDSIAASTARGGRGAVPAGAAQALRPSLVTWPGITKATLFNLRGARHRRPFPNCYSVGTTRRRQRRTSSSPSTRRRHARRARLTSRECSSRPARPSNRPIPLTRAYVDVTRLAHPDDFLPRSLGRAWGPFPKLQDNNAFIYRSSDCHRHQLLHGQLTFGPVLGQFISAWADVVSAATSASTPRRWRRVSAAAPARGMMSHPATGRRYPNHGDDRRPSTDPCPTPATSTTCPCTRACELPRSICKGPDKKLGTATTSPHGRTSIVVSRSWLPGYPIEFCDSAAGVISQCNLANAYGFHAGDYTSTWNSRGRPSLPWRTWRATTASVQWTSTRRPRACMSYGRQPSACSVLPAGRIRRRRDRRLPRAPSLPLRNRRDR